MGVLQSSLSPSSYPSSWKELAEWCEEATNLSTLLGDGVSGKLTDEGSGVDHGEDDDNDCDSVVVIKKRSAFFAYRRFILMVHRDIVVGELDGPDSYTTSTKCPKCAEVPANGKSNVRVKVYGKREVSKGKRRSLQRCRHGNIVDSSRLTLSEYFELNKLIFESIYKDKVSISVNINCIILFKDKIHYTIALFRDVGLRSYGKTFNRKRLGIGLWNSGIHHIS